MQHNSIATDKKEGATPTIGTALNGAMPQMTNLRGGATPQRGILEYGCTAQCIEIIQPLQAQPAEAQPIQPVTKPPAHE
jgi:hypothetical protein